MTPRETFVFTANMMLKWDSESKSLRVEKLIVDLGLTSCANTRIGGT
eukprot:CAMPEP_0201284644 /NCGR_PEP_ID=MMETSP1317-20130820/80367_1 /ASSEMBLY_ACC=CAM_ASM_000770 /TAXON_ID=187299 /ORGANISM="Undescribed Undescribed, Strain Undescribed" /LENGTH=46 /DNA_ID= /DNA_START= /DNA_END= /DNA_ORIENTATION=